MSWLVLSRSRSYESWAFSVFQKHLSVSVSVSVIMLSVDRALVAFNAPYQTMTMCWSILFAAWSLLLPMAMPARLYVCKSGNER